MKTLYDAAGKLVRHSDGTYVQAEPASEATSPYDVEFCEPICAGFSPVGTFTYSLDEPRQVK